ncbi:MAG: acyltransferase family protein [Oscillospiraceae bacterium]|nr:acyltransferase family protein [Oscillospiraceae bacterium]
MKFLGYFSKNYADEKGREYYFDNAKFILIVLVVLAHFTSPIKTDHPKVKALWTVINTLHMPCLIMISGYFAKGYIKNGVIKTQRLFTYIIYYLAAQLVVSLFEYFVLGYKDMAISVVSARSSLWYLVCLCWWFALLPYIYRVKPAIMLPFAIFAGLMFGYDTDAGNLLAIERAVNHFPFFLMGYYFKKEWLYKFRNVWTQLAAAVILIVSGIVTFFCLDMIPSRTITGNYSYHKSNFQNLDPQLPIFTEPELWFVNRLLFYLAAVVLCVCFMLLVPRGKAIFTKFGSRTLQVYILHRFLYLAELEYGWWEPYNSAKGFFIVSAISIAVTVILSLKIFEYPFKWLGKLGISKFENKKLPEVRIDETK